MSEPIRGTCKHDREIGKCPDCAEDDNVRRIQHQRQAEYRKARPWLAEADDEQL